MIRINLKIMVPITLGLVSKAVGYKGRINYVTSAEAKMDLLEKDKQLIILLNSYAVELQDKINVLKRIAKEFRKHLKAAKGMFSSQVLLHTLYFIWQFDSFSWLALVISSLHH